MLFVSEEEKKTFLEDTEQFYFRDSKYPGAIVELDKEKDYLIIKFNYDFDPYKGIVYIFNKIYEIKEDISFEIDKGECALINKQENWPDEYKSIIVSSNKNIIILDYSFNLKNFNNILFLDEKKSIIYVDTSKEKSILKYYTYDAEDYINGIVSFNIYIEYNLTYYMNLYGPDSLFMRFNSHSIDSGINVTYFFDINEQYYLYNKKFYGNMDFYQYNKELNIFSKISELMNLKTNLNNVDDFNIVNNKLLIISGFQLFTFINSYGALNDLYIQKVNDLEYIEINSKIFKFNNLVKLLNENKTYYLKFTVDHLIKLDNQFLDAEVTFTDKNGNTYILNNSTRIIKNLNGDGITVKSNKNALLYFYKKMDNNTELGMIEFDKSQKGKNMKFDITSLNNKKIIISVVKDFGFKGYYPMLSEKSWDNINALYSKRGNMATIYAQNLYDNLEYDLYEKEGEKYFIYMFDSIDEKNIPIFNAQDYSLTEPIYENNLVTQGNKYNFEIIPPNSNGSIILNSINRNIMNYQVLTCKSKEVNLTIENSNGFFPYYYTSYPYKQTINEDEETQFYFYGKNETIAYSFESDNEFLFFYSLENLEKYYICNSFDFLILSIIEVSENIIQIKYNPASYCLGQYHFIIAKKEDNNLELLSDPCFVAKLLIHNSSSDSFVIKTFQDVYDYDILITNIDISKLNVNKNSELIVTVFYNEVLNSKKLYIKPPLEFKLENKEPSELKLEEETILNFVNKKYFKFEYNHEGDKPQDIYFYFYKRISFEILLTIGDQTKTIKYEGNDELLKISFTKSGTYFLEFYLSNSDSYNVDFTFIAFTSGKVIEIDLNEKIYYKNSYIKSPIKLEPYIYKVKNLKEDKYVIFNYKVEVLGNNKIYENPFEICNDKTSECEQDITSYKFIKDNEYTIYINYVNQTNRQWYDREIVLYFPSYMFFPVYNDTIEEINEGYYNFTQLKIFNINLEKKNQLFLYFHNSLKKLICYSDKKVTLNNIDTFNLKENENMIITLTESENKYAIIMVIPLIENPLKLAITNQLFTDINKDTFSLKSGNNAIIYYNNININIFNTINMQTQQSNDQIEERKLRNIEEDEKETIRLPYNILTTFISPIKNMELISASISNEKYDYINQNYIPLPIYVDKSEKDINIKIKTYQPRYSFFAAINNNLFNAYENLQSQYSSIMKQYFNKEMLPINLRIDTDMNVIYEFINFYFYQSNQNINVYIKKFYGETELYECNADSIDYNDLSIITKPISNCNDKKSIFNRFYNFGGTKLITGYLGYNSLFDIYIENNDNNRDIKMTTLMSTYNNAAKYLKKDIEYNIAFIADHLVKLEPEFDAQVSIYDNKEINIILNENNRTAKIKGNNLKIKSNKDAMVYFYGKLNPGFSQLKLEPKEGNNIEIKIKKNTFYIIDFGFEGYNPMDISSIFTFPFFENDGTIYIENIYDKINTKLVDGEYLYFYSSLNVLQNIEINYDNLNLINPKNVYTFNVIPKNEEKKSLIINNKNYNKIKYQINYCKSPHSINMYYQGEQSLEEELITFDGDNQIKDQIINSTSFKLRFESNEDFVFSYSFIDSADKYANNKEDWKNERQILKELTIKEIIKKNTDDKYSNIYTINFYPNYKSSSTKYIIVIAPKNENNSKDTLSNPCYITKLVTENMENIKIINTVDIGENDLISVDVDITDMLNYANEFIVNIISQELRYDKKINYYTPIEFSHTEEKIQKIEFNSDQEFNLDENKVYFELPYIKQSQKTEMLLLNYKLDNPTSMIIQVYGPNYYEQSFKVNKEEGYVNFLCEESASYRIAFKTDETKTLRNLNSNIKGVFKILSTEYEFKLDITKNNIEFNELNITELESPSLKFNIQPLEKDYTKKIEISNIEFDEIHKIVSVNQNNKDFKSLNFHYFTFEKNINYSVIINFNQKDINKFTFERVNIKEFSSDNIQDFSFGNKKYNDVNDKFLLINWENYDSITINIKEKNPKFLISELTENQKNNFIKEFQNLNFSRVENLNIIKPTNNKYSVLMIELNQEGTEINFEEKNNNNNNDNGNENSPVLLIVLISVFGFIIIAVVAFLIIRHCKKKNQIDYNKKTENLDNEKLLRDM